jgi:hypothetical protein
VADEPAGEVVSVQEGSVADQQGDASLNWAEADGAGAERCGKVIDVHEDLRVLSRMSSRWWRPAGSILRRGHLMQECSCMQLVE